MTVLIVWWLSELVYQFVHALVALSDLLVTFCSCYHYLPWYKYQESHCWVWWLYSINQPWEYLWFVLHLCTLFTLWLFLISIFLQSLQMNWNFHVTWRDNILYFEVMVINFKAHSLNDFGIFSTGEFAILFRLCSCNDHLPTAENQPCGFRISQSHDNCSKTIWIIFSCLAFPCNLL